MGKVVWHLTMTLDGFIADPDDSVKALLERFTESSALGDEIIRTTGAFMAGGRMFRGAVGEIYGGAWKGEVFVYTRNPREAPDDAPYRYVTGNIREALEAAAGKNLVVTGGSVPRLCVEAGLVDEIIIHLAPVLLGDGVRLFSSPVAERVELERISVAQSGQMTDLRYRVAK